MYREDSVQQRRKQKALFYAKGVLSVCRIEKQSHQVVAPVDTLPVSLELRTAFSTTIDQLGNLTV